MKENTLFKQRFNGGTWITSTHVKLGERMIDACCADEKGHWRYYKNPQNNRKMYDEDNYS